MECSEDVKHQNNYGVIVGEVASKYGIQMRGVIRETTATGKAY